MKDINLATVQLWPVDSAGRWLTQRGIAVTGGFVGNDPEFYQALAQAEYQDCVWTLNFSATLDTPLPAEPAGFHVTGSGLHGGAGEFAFYAITPNQVDAAPWASLIGIGVVCDDPIDPPEPPTPPCEWEHDWIGADLEYKYLYDWGSCGGRMLILTADLETQSAQVISGQAQAFDHCWWIPQTTSVADSAATNALFKVWLEPPNCCQNCTIGVVATPKFYAYAQIDPPAGAAAAGTISIATPCGNAIAEGGIALGDYDGDSFSFYEWSVPVNHGSQPQSVPVTGNLSCVHPMCSIDISIVAAGGLSVWANANPISWADAFSKLHDATLGLTVTPQGGPGCNIEPIEPIMIQFLELPNDPNE